MKRSSSKRAPILADLTASWHNRGCDGGDLYPSRPAQTVSARSDHRSRDRNRHCHRGFGVTPRTWTGRSKRPEARSGGPWGETTPSERSMILWRVAQRLREHGTELADLESRNVEKPIAIARDDGEFAAENLEFFAGAARMLEGRAAGEDVAKRTSLIRREPIGVVAAIAPWNYPLLMAAWKLGPALAAGNTVIFKPSELTPLTTLRVAALTNDLLPPGVLNVVTGPGSTVGAALAAHPGVDMVSLTGDGATGVAVYRTAAVSMKRLHLELAGKAPMIVFDDADLDQAAARGQRSAFYNSGQDCTAACPFLVQERVLDAFLERFLDRVAARRVGNPLAPDVVLVNVDQRADIVQREVFGPVVTVQPFRDEGEVLALANDVPYGLVASDGPATAPGRSGWRERSSTAPYGSTTILA